MYYILSDDKTIIPATLLEWGLWFETFDRTVKYTDLPNGVRISTVFLGIDLRMWSKPPLLFETMIFGGEFNEFQERYCTWDEAVEGHNKAVELVFSKVFSHS